MNKGLLILAVLCAPLAARAEVVIAALGDSLTQGYGLAQSDGLVPQLQRWLDGQGAQARVINAGVSGDTTAGGLARVGWTLTPDVDAMIVTLGGNDLLRGLPPAQARANLAGILQQAAQSDIKVLLIGMEATGNFGPAYKAEFDAIYPELAQEYGTLYLRSLFEGLREGLDDTSPAALQVYFQPDGIHPNADGVARIVRGLGPQVLKLIEQVE